MNDYISREAVEQVLRGIANGISVGEKAALESKDVHTLFKIKGAKDILRSVDDCICDVPSADVQPVNQWVSVDDMLPVIDETVLAYIRTPDNHHSNIEKVYLSDKSDDDYHYWVFENGSIYTTRFKYVTYWQPLPKPPKEG